MNITEYRKLNDSYKRTLVFHFGSGAGFFSEYNNMLKAIAYCLVHKIKFVLYSADATFASGKGWTDFFEPFCEEDINPLHSKFNKRFPEQWHLGNLNYRTTISFSRYIKGYLAEIKSILIGARKIKEGIKNCFCEGALGSGYVVDYHSFKKEQKDIKQFKKENRITYLTSDIWCDIHTIDTRVKVKNVLFEGNVETLIFEIEKMIWKFNPQVQECCRSLIANLTLPKNVSYVGMHIRRGDKFEEAKLQPVSEYFKILNYVSTDYEFIFISSDDSSVVNEIKNNYKGKRIFTLSDINNEKGYDQSDFSVLNIEDKRNHIIHFFASIEILKKSEIFVGTISSNIAQYLKMYIKPDNFYSLD